MDRLEHVLREDLARQVRDAPPSPGLAERAVRGARRTRRRRTVAGAAAVAAAAVAAVAVAVPTLVGDDRPAPAASIEGPPRVPVLTQDGDLVDWPAGVRRSRAVGADVTPVATVPTGVLLLAGDADARSLVLVPAGSDSPHVLIGAVAADAAAVSPSGDRVTVVTGEGARRNLTELEVPDGRVLRAVTLAPPLVSDDEDLRVVAYSGERVLLSIGEGPGGRAAIWEPGDDQVVGVLDGYVGAVDGSGGRGAFLTDDECVEVTQLRSGARPWSHCAAQVLGFSADGDALLTLEGEALVVYDTRLGDVRRRIGVPADVHTAGWETDDTVLYTAPAGEGTDIVRCSTTSAACATAAQLPEGSEAQPIEPHWTRPTGEEPTP